MRNIAVLRDECIALLDGILTDPSASGTISDMIWREARLPWQSNRAAKLVMRTVNDHGKRGRYTDPMVLLREVRARIAASK